MQTVILLRTCGMVAKIGFKHCITKDYISTGEMLINEAISGTAAKIHIKHRIFNYNGHFGEVIDVEDLELPSKYMEIANGAGLLVEIAKCNNVNVSILIENTSFSNNHGRAGAGARICILILLLTMLH